MKRQTIKTNFLETVDWLGTNVIDWISAGQLYNLNGETKQIAKYHYPFACDAAITSQDGIYAFVYQRLGTKGILLKNGEMIREINRSYFFADRYEFPATFATINGLTYLIHCPIEFDRLDFEDVESGTIVTAMEGRNPEDIFHSRLSTSPDGKKLMVCGWQWHPVEVVNVYDIAACLDNPLLLDRSTIRPDFGTEINSASFIDNEHILISSSCEEPFDDEEPSLLPPNTMAIWNFSDNTISTPIRVDEEIGNIFAINMKLAWDLYKFPKIINLLTGEVIAKLPEINSGTQNSSIYSDTEKNLQIRFNRELGAIAIRIDSTTIEILFP